MLCKDTVWRDITNTKGTLWRDITNTKGTVWRGITLTSFEVANFGKTVSNYITIEYTAISNIMYWGKFSC